MAFYLIILGCYLKVIFMTIQWSGCYCFVFLLIFFRGGYYYYLQFTYQKTEKEPTQVIELKFEFRQLTLKPLKIKLRSLFFGSSLFAKTKTKKPFILLWEFWVCNQVDRIILWTKMHSTPNSASFQLRVFPISFLRIYFEGNLRHHIISFINISVWLSKRKELLKT